MRIDRVEPLSWWTGMHTPLQLMFYGSDLQNAKVRCLEKGITVLQTHQAESKNYLFVDLLIDADAQPGKYSFEFSQGGKKIIYPYLIQERRAGSAQRKGFGSEDMIYLIMPDRFANGDPANDSHKDAVEIANRELPYGRHGGDIQGIINHLDYLLELGVTAIWNTPLLFDNEPVASYHGYACADYYRIDPRFGSNDLYKQLVNLAHQRGIKMVMDMVPNHCGLAHWWMNDLPFASWIHQFPQFTRSNYMMASHFDPHSSKLDNDLCVQGWFDTSMPDMNLAHPFVLNYFTMMAIWWIEYANLDGLRIDTFPYSNKYAMATWCQHILDEYPHLSLVGESWFSVPSMIAYWEGAANNQDRYTSHLSAVMDFPLQEAITEGFVKDSLPQWGQGLMKVYNTLTQDFVYANPNALMIFADNHDTNRMAWLLKGKKEKQKMALTLLATMRGIPQLYYGSEVMLYNKKERGHGEERLDMPGGWPNDLHSVFLAQGRTKIENEVFDHTKKLFTWRKTATVIHTGKLLHFVPQENNFYVYFRYSEDELVMVAINNSRASVEIEWDRYQEITSKYSDLTGTEIFTERRVHFGSPITLQPQRSMVVHFQ